MSRSRRREIGNNHANKRGIITERDGDNQRVRVQFADEDGVTSMWIDVLGQGSSANASFDMPDEGDEVWCGLDPSGEGGCVLGTRYNAKDRPQQTDPKIKQRNFADGSVETHDTATGNRVLEITGTYTIRGNVIIEGAVLTHNGTDISDQHKHRDVMAGLDQTGTPV